MSTCAHCHQPLDGAHEWIVRCPQHGEMHERCTTDRSGGFSNDSVCWTCGSTCSVVARAETITLEKPTIERGIRVSAGFATTELPAGDDILAYLAARPRAEVDAALARLAAWFPKFPAGFDWWAASGRERLRALARARVRAGDEFWRDAL